MLARAPPPRQDRCCTPQSSERTCPEGRSARDRTHRRFDMTEQAATIPGGWFPRMTQQALAVWRRLPFTTTVVVVMVVLALATGALWRPALEQPSDPDVASRLTPILA